MIIKLKTVSPTANRKTSPQSYKIQINILPFPGLAQSGTEQPGQGATLLGWPKSIHYRLYLEITLFCTKPSQQIIYCHVTRLKC